MKSAARFFFEDVKMDLRGFNKFSLVDYPGRIGCIVFTGGCNLRCPFCHNPCLVFDPSSQPRVTDKEFFNFLRQRKGLIEGVVISGGEPMLQPDICDFVKRIREAGYLAKIDSNGTFPDRIRKLLDTAGADSMGIDYKAPRAKYAALTGVNDPEIGDKVAESIRMVLEAGIELDVRTTVHRALLSEEDLKSMHGELCDLGVSHWMLQQFNPVEVIDDDLPAMETYTDRELVAIAKRLGPDVQVRGLHGRVIV